MYNAQFFGKRSQSVCLSLFILGMGLWVAWTSTSPSYAQAQPQQTVVPEIHGDRQRLLQKIGTANIIYLGETHDSLADHQAQLGIAEALQQKNPRMAIALEMFQKPYQSAIDGYLNNTLSEAELLEQTQYKKRWGFDWEFYAPILRFAKAKRIPVLALNTPTEITRKVARSGLETLSADDFKWIPPRSEIDLSNASYRKRILETYESFHQGKGNSDGFERFFQAQVLWDETMAAAIAQYWLKYPDRQIVVLVGQGHVIFGEGIPSRVARRLNAAGQKKWKQVSVLLNPSPEIKNAASKAADFFWFSEAQPRSGS
jgi:uncharacterized iron-regulated protein